MSAAVGQRRMLAILALTQIASWGSLYYSITIFAPHIQREMGWRQELVYGAFSWSLVVAGLAAAPAGAWLDRIGGRVVMAGGSLLAGAGMLLLSWSAALWSYFLAWSLLGAAMALTLYEAAFATINREFALDARKTISTLTLFGGFASTVFWPLTLQLTSILGWRQTCLAYAALHLAVCLPAHLLLPAAPPRAKTPGKIGAAAASDGDYSLQQALRHPAFWKLAFAFAANAFIFAALSAHLIPMLTHFGHPAATAVALAALIGPMQVVGRIAERLFFHQAPPQNVGRFAFAALPAGLLALLLLHQRQWAVAFFCVLYGLSNGIQTIVRGTVPQLLFGRQNYGAISGAMAAPGLVGRATGPLLLAVLLGAGLEPDLLLAVLLGIAVLALLCFLAATMRIDKA
ncbi:MFS transporter [Massilia sp. erpn]|uniref:MFS transporter n=1 Tax=Massilia sp. erpn TaxID=2738142 RepID=UPI0021059A08|nr:MFS transporter [Massilia sp. erpn]UTY59592.1 MFS transporter [Massilia sp. erpn]